MELLGVEAQPVGAATVDPAIDRELAARVMADQARERRYAELRDEFNGIHASRVTDDFLDALTDVLASLRPAPVEWPKWVEPDASHVAIGEEGRPSFVHGYPDAAIDRDGKVTVLVQDEDEAKAVTSPREEHPAPEPWPE